jgi:hypothetical protein
MKYLYITSLLFCLTGCSTWLRYNYESALTELPKDAKVIKITNDYIEYNVTNSVYKAYYDVNGKIYEIKH